MLPVTEQLFSLKRAGDQNPSAKHSMSGGYVEGNSSSLDDMVSNGQQNKEENEAPHYLSVKFAVAFFQPSRKRFPLSTGVSNFYNDEEPGAHQFSLLNIVN